MIQKNELRVGNKVFNVDNDIVTVHETRDEFYLIESGSGQYYKTSNGIELSPEILEICGFMQDESYNGSLFIYLNKHDLDVDKISFSKSDGMVRIEIPGRRGSCILMKYIQYLHQLQNLYYSLTGEELTFKQ